MCLNAFSFDHNYVEYGKLLRNAVVDQGFKSVVKYKELKNKPEVLRQVRKSFSVLTKEQLGKFSKDEKIAYFVNAYNFYTIELITKHYPLSSIKSLNYTLGSPWSHDFIPLSGKLVSLDHLEHEILRKDFQDPRIHFVLVCASRGCPKLYPTPFTAKNLDKELNTATKLYLKDTEINYIVKNEVYISPIFKWFKEDFETKQYGSPLKFVAKFMSMPKSLKKIIDKGKLKPNYSTYDWSLNSAVKTVATWYNLTQEWYFVPLCLFLVFTLFSLGIKVLRYFFWWAGVVDEFVNRTITKLNLFNRLKLNNKVSFLITIIALANFTFLYWKVQKDIKESLTLGLKQRLLKSVGTAAVGLDFPTHNGLYNRYLNQEKEIMKSKEFMYLAKKMKSYQEMNNLQNDVYTVFIPYWAPDNMIFMATSAKKPYLGNGVEATGVIQEVYRTKKPAISNVYHTDTGSWISGAAPIYDDKGEVHAVLLMDIDTQMELEFLLEKSSKKILIPVAALTLFGLILTLVGVRFLTNALVRKIIEASSLVRDNVDSLNHEIESSKTIGANLLRITGKLGKSADLSRDISGNISTVVKSMSDEVEHNSIEVKECEDVCNSGFDALNKLESEIENIEKTMKGNSDEIRMLSNSIRSIIEVVTKIKTETEALDSITFQTKLLAFNASVEAARAGEAGKGFSVVAGEMGNLSAESQKSARAIENIISDSIQKINVICNNFDSKITEIDKDSVGKLEALNEKREFCLKSFELLLEKVASIKRTNKDLKDSFETSDLATAINKMNDNIVNIKFISQENKLEADSSKSVSEELSKRSQSLDKTSNHLIGIVGSKEET